jgi:hypothetical protein
VAVQASNVAGMSRLALALVPVLAIIAVACGGGAAKQVATPPGSPASAASGPTPVAVPPHDYGPPPDGVELVYVQDPGSPSWLIGFDWQGRPRATVHLKELDGAGVGPAAVSVAPNGAGFEGGSGATGAVYTFDRLGRLVYQYVSGAKGGMVSSWSEDGAVLCGIDESISQNDTTDFFLVRRAPTVTFLRVARFQELDGVPGDLGYDVFACSNRLDRALVVKTVCCGVQGAIAIRLSDGTILGTWERDAGSPIFSPDGQLVADPTVDPAGATTSTVVSLLLGGTVLARYGPGVAFRAFSSDNQLAVVVADRAGGPVAQVIEVATRRVVWQDGSSRSVSGVWARPGTADMAIAFTASPEKVPCPGASSQSCINPSSQVVIVRQDGSSVDLKGSFLLPGSAWKSQ